jgi:hypothetical protein
MPVKHKVEKGECISSIAEKYGFFPETIWESEENSKLKELRKDPNVLLAGDPVTIPDKRLKEVAIQTGERHKFKRKGVPARFRLKIMNGDVPRSNIAFTLLIDEKLKLEGETDGDGILDVSIPPTAKKGVITLDDGQETIKVSFGHLDPVTEADVVRQRLFNLGLLETSDAPDSDLTAAVRMFQRIKKLEPTGVVNDETRNALVEAHDNK